MAHRGILCFTRQVLSCRSASTLGTGTGGWVATSTNNFKVSVLPLAIACTGRQLSSKFFTKLSHNNLHLTGWKSRLKDCILCFDKKATEVKVKFVHQRTMVSSVYCVSKVTPVICQTLSLLNRGAFHMWMKIDYTLNFVTTLFAKQCNRILAMRVKRSMQIVNFYSKLGYDKQAVKDMIQKLSLNFARQTQRFRRTESLAFLFSTAALFNWEEKKIKEQEMNETADEMSLIRHSGLESDQMDIDASSSMIQDWEKVINRENLVAFRKLLPNSTHQYEYKVFGTFKDIPARAFFNAQLDLEHRKQWDKLIIKLDVIDRDDKSGTEVIQWITHFPYPMYHREYVFLRRSMIDTKQKLMVIVSRDTEHPSCPISDQVVRVDTYISKMVIKPHSSSFDEDGFDYIVTYYDDPKANIPTMAYKWLASTGVPDFVEKIHAAAKTLHEKRKGVRPHEDGDFQASSTGGVPM